MNGEEKGKRGRRQTDKGKRERREKTRKGREGEGGGGPQGCPAIWPSNGAELLLDGGLLIRPTDADRETRAVLS